MKANCLEVALSTITKLGFFGLIFLILLSPTRVSAATSSYYDWGPYYSQPQVLGITFSSLEKLPVPELPQEAEVPKATGILPGNPLHFIEKFVEGTQLAFTPGAVQKEELRLSFAQERLSEARTLAELGKYAQAEDAVSSYQETMRTVTQSLATLGNNTPDTQELIATIEQTAARNNILAQNLTLSSPPAFAGIWTSAQKASEEALDQAADLNGDPTIPQELSTSLQKLKEQGLLTPEESENLYGLKTRTEVRAELEKLTSAGQFPISEAIKLNQAVAENHPDMYKQTNTLLQFAEIRTYETFPQPTEEIQKQVEEWQRSPNNIPPPTEIRPYLYHTRGEELAKQIDLTSFPQEQQTEIAKFYPQAVAENSSFTIPTSPENQPTPTPTPEEESEAQPDTTLTPTPTQAPSSQTPYLTEYQGPLPGTPTYFFKSLGEGTRRFFTFDPGKRLELEMQYADERLKEANALSLDKEKVALYEQTLKRYQETMDSLSGNVKDWGGPESKKDELAEKLESEAARHSIIFEKGLLPSPGTNTVILGDMILTVQDAMDISADIQGKPALPESLSNRLQDMKVQGLLLPEEAEQLTQAKTREEVRDKVRKLTEIGTFPPADAKKLDEGQSEISPQDYNQLIEVRKVQELQRLRSIQREFAQTATLRANNTNYAQRIEDLIKTIDTSLINQEDLAGRERLTQKYQELEGTTSTRPINAGQFTQGIGLETPTKQDAVLGTCPEGAVFKQFEGCVWQDSGKSLNDYEQYRCDPGQYWSFATNKCAPYKPGSGQTEDSQPICPLGYQWSWQAQSCQTATGDGSILPVSQPKASPPAQLSDEEKAKYCPDGTNYNSEKGCVWTDTGKSLYEDEERYRCGSNRYYSFAQKECVPNPPQGESPTDAQPTCPDDKIWRWSIGKCEELDILFPTSTQKIDLTLPKPTFVAPGNPFYFIKQVGEAIQTATAFTEKAKQEVRLAHAKERFAEGFQSLQSNDEEGFTSALAKYTTTMQEIYNDASKIEGLDETTQRTFGEKLEQAVIEQNLLLQKATVLGSSDLGTPISAANSVTIQGIDRANDLQGEPPIPEDIKGKIESLPDEMLKPEDKQKILEIESRVGARIELGKLVALGGLTQSDTAALDEAAQEDTGALAKLTELKKLDELEKLSSAKEEAEEKIGKTEDIERKLDEFQKTFQPGQEVPAEIRPYISLTRIEEVTRTIRPDIIEINDFGNRKDVQLAVATLQQEFKPTKDSFKKLEDFRRNNPGRPLPFELARTEALAFGLGVREQAGPCFLPSPPFPQNTACPAPGAAIAIASYDWGLKPENFSIFGPRESTPATGGTSGNTTDEKGNPLVYGKGPEGTSPGNCPSGYHWMYDSGGWCMSNSGSYSSSYNYTPTGTGTSYTPYSPYYTAPGAPPATYGYTNDPNFVNPYSPPNYYGIAPTYYTTNPPPGTVPGSGPKPTAPGQCTSGYHWMSDSGGWCMANSNTYVPPGTPDFPSGTATTETGSYNCGSQPYDPVTKKCKDGACPGGFFWDGSKCIAGNYLPGTPGGGGSGSNTPWCWSAFPPPGGWSCEPGSNWDSSTCSCKSTGSTTYTGGGSSASSYQYGCTPGSYWDGSKCVQGNYSGPGWSDSAARSQSWCQPPSSGCGSNNYWDYGSCTCRSSNTSFYSGGSGTGGTAGSCSPPSGGCGSGYFDSGTCSCKQASSQGCYNVSASSCGSGFYWDAGLCTCRSNSDSGSSTSSTGNTSTNGGSTSSSGSCPSGYHWMSDSGGWCMSDGSSSPTSTSGSTTPPTSTPAPTTTEPAPAPSPEPAPTTAPSEPAPTTAP